MLVNDKMIIISSPEIEPNITVICFWWKKNLYIYTFLFRTNRLLL